VCARHSLLTVKKTSLKVYVLHNTEETHKQRNTNAWGSFTARAENKKIYKKLKPKNYTVMKALRGTTTEKKYNSI